VNRLKYRRGPREIGQGSEPGTSKAQRQSSRSDGGGTALASINKTGYISKLERGQGGITLAPSDAFSRALDTSRHRSCGNASKEEFARSRQTYGSPRLAQALEYLDAQSASVELGKPLCHSMG
jgi:hypothetical protein